MSRRGLRPAQLALLSSSVLDVPLLRQLIRAELSQESLGKGGLTSRLVRWSASAFLLTVDYNLVLKDEQ